MLSYQIHNKDRIVAAQVLVKPSNTSKVESKLILSEISNFRLVRPGFSFLQNEE